MSTYTSQAEVRLKDGTAIREGAVVLVEWGPHPEGVHKVTYWPKHGVEKTARLLGKTVGKMIAGGFPTDEELAEWATDSVCPTPAGDAVEPDGHGPDGCPSWLMLLGLV